ncbi:MAG: ThuA domain-containing protein [Phenylobacterium sp.]
MGARTTLALVATLVSLAGSALAQTGNPGGAINDNLGDFDYGVCRGTDPRCFHDWKRAPTTQYKVLLFTRTAGPRHASLGDRLPPGKNPVLNDTNVVHKGMLKLAQDNGWQLDYTEDLNFTINLMGYNAVVFFSPSRDTLDDDSKTALRQYMRAGGGFVAIHNAFGTMYNWPYYEGLLGGANFYDHGPHRTGDVVIVDRKDASTKGLPRRFAFKDEWYNLVPFPTKVRFLATVDETSWTEVKPGSSGVYPPGANPRQPPGPPMPRVVGVHPGHGDFHPVAWCQYYDGGKAWVTTLGHDAGVFSTDGSFPGAAEFRAMVTGGLKSVMGAEPFCR